MVAGTLASSSIIQASGSRLPRFLRWSAFFECEELSFRLGTYSQSYGLAHLECFNCRQQAKSLIELVLHQKTRLGIDKRTSVRLGTTLGP